MTSLAMTSWAMTSFVPTVNPRHYPPLPSLLPSAYKCRSYRKVRLQLWNRNLLHPMQSSYYPAERTPSQVDSRTMHGENDEWLISFFHYHQNTHHSAVRRSCAKCHRCFCWIRKIVITRAYKRPIALPFVFSISAPPKWGCTNCQTLHSNRMGKYWP